MKNAEFPFKTLLNWGTWVCFGAFTCLSGYAQNSYTVSDVVAPNGVVDEADIQHFIDLAEVSGGAVHIPAGTYTLNATLTIQADGVFLSGEDVGTTILEVADDVDNHAISCFGADRIGIRDLTIDGNRDQQTAGHGIRLENVVGGWFSRLHIRDTHGYGIGAEESENPPETPQFHNLHFSQITIERPGLDGIDFKNPDDSNRALHFSNITIIEPGAGETSGNFAGMDIRGEAHLNNITVRDVDHDTSPGSRYGIRFRETGEDHGIGGRYSTLSNFRVEGSGNLTVGVYLADLEIQVSNGHILGTQVGLRSFAKNNAVVNVTARSCGTGFHLMQDPDPPNALGGKQNRLTNCSAISCGTGFSIEDDRCSLIGNLAHNNSGPGYEITATANDTIAVGNQAIANNGTGNDVVDNGTNTHQQTNTGSGW